MSERGGYNIKLIAGVVLTLFCVLLIVRLLRRQEKLITLEEVIPEARIVSYEEGIIEFRDVQYILGRGSLHAKKKILEHLKLLNLEGPYVIDLRFKTQVIIREGPRSDRFVFGPDGVQTRRR